MKKTAITLFILISALTTGQTCFAQNFSRKTVLSSKGVIVGHDDENNTISFKGIPYAQAPVGKLRFKAPRQTKPWIMPLMAKNYGSACKQIGNIFAVESSSELSKPYGSEDCLFLNIWTPKKTSAKKPIFFWIHGGSNYKGKSSDPNYRGAYFADRHDAIFVSVNYRLGHFGAFLNEYTPSTEQKDHSPNLVTLDLISALKWVKENAKAFGGDENNITIAGQSAGCMNVWGLIQSPMAKDLFHKAICSAGLPNTYPMTLAKKKSDLIVHKLIEKKYPNVDAKEFIKGKSKEWMNDFLQTVSADDIVAIDLGPVPFQHFNDGIVLPRGGWASLLAGQFNRVPLMIGATKDEFSAVVAGATLKINIKELYDLMIDETKPELEFNDLITMKSQKEYALLVENGTATMHALLDSINAYVANFVPALYRYHFEWNLLPTPWDKVLGSLHGMDAIFYLGNFESNRPNFANFAWNEINRESREKMREDFAVYIDGFIKSGNPNAHLKDDLIAWPKWTMSPLKDRRLLLNEKSVSSNDYIHYPILMNSLSEVIKYIEKFYDNIFYQD